MLIAHHSHGGPQTDQEAGAGGPRGRKSHPYTPGGGSSTDNGKEESQDQVQGLKGVKRTIKQEVQARSSTNHPQQFFFAK